MKVRKVIVFVVAIIFIVLVYFTSYKAMHIRCVWFKIFTRVRQATPRANIATGARSSVRVHDAARSCRRSPLRCASMLRAADDDSPPRHRSVRRHGLPRGAEESAHG